MTNKDLVFFILLTWGMSVLINTLSHRSIRHLIEESNVIEVQSKCFTRSTQGDQDLYHPIKCPWGNNVSRI